MKPKAEHRRRAGEIDYPFFDTESWNDEQGRARLVYMSCYSTLKKGWVRTEDPDGISTFDALTWMVENLPGAEARHTRQTHSLIAWFFGGYDMSLILRDLPAWLHWLLLHPDKRRIRTPDQKTARIHPVRWRGFTIDWLNGMFTVERDGWRITIFDICRYYQCSFLKALNEWRIGTEEELKQIERGKAARGSFSKRNFRATKRYCDTETRLGAELWQKLRLAHDEVKLRPSRWFGPGQTAKAALTKMYARCYGTEQVGPGRGEVAWKRLVRKARLDIPLEAWPAIASAFFGGRFENEKVGSIEDELWSADVASAYPWAITQLPCLVHGAWRYESHPTLRDIERATLACVNYELGSMPNRSRESIHWAPLPFREADGSICFPVNCSGWVWKPEFLEARKHGFELRARGAWLYHTSCDCALYTRGTEDAPSIRELYGFRLRIGKEGPGMVVKYALNSGYGVKAQVLGIVEYRSLSPFQSFVEAGMITALARTKLAQAIRTVGPQNVLMVATDSVLCRIDPSDMLDTSKAPELGPDGKQKGELGSWEIDHIPDGMVLVKQGIYFDRKFLKLKARGIGRDPLKQNAKLVERALARWIAGKPASSHEDPNTVVFEHNRDIFHGQRECTDCLFRAEPGDWQRLALWAESGREKPPSAARDFRKRDSYGTWDRRAQEIKFTAHPKRERVMPDGRLVVRDMRGAESKPYDKALGLASLLLTPEAEAERLQIEALQDFPDGDYEGIWE